MSCQRRGGALTGEMVKVSKTERSIATSGVRGHHIRKIIRRGRRCRNAFDDTLRAGDKVLDLLEVRVLGIDGGDLEEQMLEALDPSSNDLWDMGSSIVSITCVDLSLQGRYDHFQIAQALQHEHVIQFVGDSRANG